MATKNLEPTANTPKTHRVPHTKKKHASERGRALCEVRRALWCFSAGVVWLMENGEKENHGTGVVDGEGSWVCVRVWVCKGIGGWALRCIVA